MREFYFNLLDRGGIKFIVIKKSSKILLIIFILFCFTDCELSEFFRKEEENELKIGITVYKQEDKFISYMIKAIEEYVIKKENETNSKITINIVDAKGNTTAQNNQVDKFLKQDYDIICVNIVDRTAASIIINKAKKHDIPIVFFNREPVEEDINLWNKVYYVGAIAQMAGDIQGKIIAEEYKKNKGIVDKNNDDKIQYVMLEGEPEHQDSLIRTEATITSVVSEGIEVDKLDDYSANWQNLQAYEKTTQWINEFGEKIEVIFSNNDDMAIGAIKAYENVGIALEDRPLIVGIDGIPEALTCIKDRTMKGTVYNNYIEQAKKVVDKCYELWSKDEGDETIRKYFKSSYEKITEENVNEYIVQ